MPNATQQMSGKKEPDGLFGSQEIRGWWSKKVFHSRKGKRQR
jgi:hypothetical protein